MSIVVPVVRPVVLGVVRGLFGDGGASGLPVWYAAGSQYMLDGSNDSDADHELHAQLIGEGSPSFTTPADFPLPDWENVYRENAEDSAPWHGARKVTNLALQSEDLEDGVWTTSNSTITPGQTDPNGGTTAYRLTATGASGRIRKTNITSAGDACSSWWIRRVTGSGIIQIYRGNTSWATMVPVTTTWQRLAADPVTVVVSGHVGVIAITSGDEIDIWHPQMEDVTGQTNQAPSAYIPTTTAAVTKHYSNENGNTVTSNVVTETVGSPLSVMPSLLGQPAATNSQTYSNDLTNGTYTPTNMTVTKDQIGMRGEANGACKLVATAGNATVIGAAITAASDDQTTRWFIKRDTGTGVVEITVDGGSTWQDVTTEVDSTAGFNECMESLAATANPATGIRVVTSGDAVHVGNDECHTAKIASEVAGSAPIFTAGATVSHAETVTTVDKANHDDSVGSYFLEFTLGSLHMNFLGGLNSDGVTGGKSFYKSTGYGGEMRYKDAANNLASVNPSGSEIAGVPYKAAVRWNAATGSMRVNLRNTWGTEETDYSGTWDGIASSVLRIMRQPNDTSKQGPVFIRNIHRYVTDDESKIDELML